MSLITPTTVHHGGLAAPLKLPHAQNGGQWDRGPASRYELCFSSTIATGCLPVSSSSVKVTSAY